MLAIASVQCPFCGARLPQIDYLCSECGAEVAMYMEDLRLGSLFLLISAGSILGAMIAFTGAMFWVGIVETHRLVLGAWGFTALALLGLLWVREQLKPGLYLDPGSRRRATRMRTSISNTSEDAATATTQRRYDRQAALFDLTELPMELLVFKGLRRRLWGQIDGQRVLEIGVGTGKNIPFHPAKARVVAIDLSPRMLSRAVARAGRLEHRPDFVLADAQHLPFRDGAFEETASTFVFCSVPDPIAGFKEARRVVRDDGHLNLLEHVRAPNRLLGWLMDRLNPIAVRLMGANINRDTVANVERAGIQLDSVESEKLGIIRLIRGLHPGGAPAGAENAGESSGAQRREGS